MGYTVRKLTDAMVHALVAERNAAREASVTDQYHADVTQITGGDYQNPTVAADTVTAANATDLATSLVLVNQIRGVQLRHFADTVAHDTALTAATTLAEADDLTTANALANDMKAEHNTHAADTDAHFNADSSNTVTNADATDQTTLNTLLNEIKADINAHVVDAPAGNHINLVPA
jgi:hypothetical protein